MARIILLISLLGLACGRPAPRLDQSAVNADSVVDMLNNRTYHMMKSFQFDRARVYLDSVRPLLSDHYGIQSTWWRLRGKTFVMNTQVDSCRIFVRKALALAYQIDTLNEYVLWAKQMMGMQHMVRREYDTALKYLFEAYHSKDMMSPIFVSLTAGQIAETFLYTGDLENCIRYLRESYDAAPDQGFKSIVANNIAACYERLGKSDSANFYLAESQMYKGRESNAERGYKIANQSQVLFKSGKFDESLRYMMEAMDILRRHKLITADQYIFISGIYSQKNDYERSNLYLDSAVNLAQLKNDYRNLDAAFVHLANNYMDKGQFRKAFEATDSSRKYHNVQDSVSFAEKAREIETQYKVKDMDQRIASLTVANALSRQISQQRLVILITVIAGSLLLLAVMFLLARRRQVSLQMQQTNLLQRLLRSQMDSHFIFNMLSVLQGFVLGGLLDRAAAYLNRCAKLLQVSLVNARENYVRLEDEVAALESYLDMQRLQLGERFQYAVNVYEGYQEDMLLIPPMLIQPFVENSVIHGVRELTDRQGMVQLTITKNEQALHCTIADNGNGLQDTVKGDKPSLAMEITRDRLQVLGRQTGRKAGFTVRNKTEMEGPGVIVEITIPYRWA